MEDILAELKKISLELKDIKDKLLIYEVEKAFEDWIPRKKLMLFLDYGETQMCALLKNENLQVAEIGNRKFIKKQSILSLLEKQIRV